MSTNHFTIFLYSVFSCFLLALPFIELPYIARNSNDIKEIGNLNGVNLAVN